MGTIGSGGYFEFNPELIVEVTMVCDRACQGCYAPNLVSRGRAQAALARHPELFLKPEVLSGRLSEIASSLKRQLTSLSFRGGEPTRHPELPALIALSLRFTRRLFVETHGRWLLPGQDAGPEPGEALRVLARQGVTVKVSFDSMHGTTAAELKELLGRLDRQGVNWLVAITEPDAESFLARRELCGPVADSKIVRQLKVARASELYAPPLGVIRTDGAILHSLSARRAF
ncbi:MAG TPA: radical SAM protein [Pyrinomonadaceae bacterium]|jgi:hypothetical protein